jgi:hypothetical protein
LIALLDCYVLVKIANRCFFKIANLQPEVRSGQELWWLTDIRGLLKRVSDANEFWLAVGASEK